MAQKRFVFLTDLHWGYERRGGHKVPIHDQRALDAALEFIADFKPHHVILGGDMLDSGPVSRHHKGKPGLTEGMKLLGDATELREALIQPLEKLVPGRLVYHIGNHEDWIQDLVDEVPALEGILSVEALLKLSKRWEVVAQGKASNLGRLVFLHGDQISGGDHVAKTATIYYEKAVRFGHFHTYQVYSKSTPLDSKAGRVGIAVPALCKRDQLYIKGKPNKFVQGFLWGYVDDHTGFYTDYVTTMVEGRFTANGKEYGK